MVRTKIFILLLFTTIITSTPFLGYASAANRVELLVIEYVLLEGKVKLNAIPLEDDSQTNGNYKLLSFHWYVTANYWINPSNRYGFSTDNVVNAITKSADAWDVETSSQVFSYKGTTKRKAGTYDGYNVISWDAYKSGVIAVTYIWTTGNRIIESDTRMNSIFAWSLKGEAKKMDVQNIMTHEFGHWAGLADLYSDEDYWLTMYGYAGYGETYKRTLGLGDINGLEAVYGP
ncbi:MAG: matrixin family metalloprotease [Thermoproteota archaeon]